MTEKIGIPYVKIISKQGKLVSTATTGHHQKKTASRWKKNDKALLLLT